jgi:L-ascorbate metabolism protein UlaG (beta-lactamase superfamily)
MMIPIDAMTNLGFDDILKVIEQVKPPIVIPMHFDIVTQGELFAAFAKEHYPVKKFTDSQLVLSRAMLPKSTEVFVLAHPRAVSLSE